MAAVYQFASIVVTLTKSHLIGFLPNFIYGLSKDNRVFFKKVRVIFIYCLKRTSIGVHKKNIIYQRICMTKYILTIWSRFTPQCVPSYTGQEISGQKS